MIRPLLATFLAIALCGCAETDFYSPATGKRIARFQGDMTQVTFSGGGITFSAATVTHSSATLAGGQAFKMGADSIGTTVVAGILAGGLPWAKAAECWSRREQQHLQSACACGGPGCFTGTPLTMKRKTNNHCYSLGDLILAISSMQKNKRETVSSVADLLSLAPPAVTSYQSAQPTPIPLSVQAHH